MKSSALGIAVQVGLHTMQPVPAHFQKLVQLVGRAFYASECPPRDQDPEATQGPRKGTKVRTASATMPFLSSSDSKRAIFLRADTDCL